MRRLLAPALAASLVVALGALAGCGDHADQRPHRAVVSAPTLTSSGHGERRKHRKHHHKRPAKHRSNPAASTNASTLPASAVAVAGQIGAGQIGAGQIGAGQAGTTAAKPAATKPLGVSYGDQLVWMSDADLSQALDDAVALHATWIRMDVSWRDLQYTSSSASYRWSLTDRVVEAAAARHLQVLAVLDYAPPWAKDPGCTAFGCPPNDPRAFARYAANVAARYRGRIAAYEIWNEENLDVYWTSPDPQRYADLLRTAVPSIRTADPSAVLLFGGLGYNKGEPGRVRASTFLAAACANGACDGVDALAYHPYTYPYLAGAKTTFHTAWERISSDTSGDPSLVSALTTDRVGGMKVWVTEYGAPTDGPGTVADGSAASLRVASDHVTTDLQAQIVADGARVAWRDPAVGAYFVYTWRDSLHPTAPGDYYGLRYADGTAKPSFAALAHAFADPGGTDQVQ